MSTDEKVAEKRTPDGRSPRVWQDSKFGKQDVKHDSPGSSSDHELVKTEVFSDGNKSGKSDKSDAQSNLISGITWSNKKLRMHLLAVVFVILAIYSSFGFWKAAPSYPASIDNAVVRDLRGSRGDNYGIPGLSHLTIAGALRHGLKEVEVWLQTLAPGLGTPVHKHNCEEVFLVLKGKGTLYLAPTSDAPYPGEPEEFSIYANSTFIIPANEVHKIQNTNQDEDFQILVIISRPPLKGFTYKDWQTPHSEAQLLFPFPWDADLVSSADGQCDESITGISCG